nr:hypothetical protein [Tanacetum cinerariifolium]
MAELSSHNHSLPEITPKEEPVTLDKPKILNPFLPADQIELSFDEIAFTTNNEVALLYPLHQTQNTLGRKVFTRAPTQYVEYLVEFWYTAKSLEYSKIWVSTPTGGIREEIGYNSQAEQKIKEKVVPYPRLISFLLEYMMPEYDNEELTINPTQVFSVHNWVLKLNQMIGPPFIDHMKAICNLDVPMDSKALKTSLQTKESTSGHDDLADSTAKANPGNSAPNDSIPSQKGGIRGDIANGVNVDYAKLIWEDIIHNLYKKARENVVPYPRFISFLLEYMMPTYENEELTINPT